MSGVVVLLYNLDSDKGRKIEKFCRSIALKPVAVSQSDYNKPIEDLLEDIKNIRQESNICEAVSKLENTEVNLEENTPGSADSEHFTDEMLVLCGFNGKLLDIFLREYKKRHIEPVSLKAMLTEHNRSWTSVELHAELCRERAAFTKR